MNNFKRFLALILVLCMGLCLCACGNDQGDESTTTPSKDATGTSGTQGTTGTTQTTGTTGTTSDGKVDYLVTVLYPDGTPVVGCWVQICMEDLCYTPAETDENGVAAFRLAQQEGYKTKLAAAVAGYVLDDYIYFEEGATEITITLVAEE